MQKLAPSWYFDHKRLVIVWDCLSGNEIQTKFCGTSLPQPEEGDGGDGTVDFEEVWVRSDGEPFLDSFLFL